MTPLAALQLRADSDRVLAACDVGMLKVLTRYVCETCHGTGRVERGEFGFDCADMHNGGRLPDAPGYECCDDCGGTGAVEGDEFENEPLCRHNEEPLP